MNNFGSVAVRLVIIVMMALVAVKADAQDSTGTISGLVQDVSGAAVSGTAVKIVNEATSSAVNVVSNEQGRYEAASLPPGSYRIEVAVEGFETAVQQVVLSAGQTVAGDTCCSRRHDWRKA